MHEMMNKGDRLPNSLILCANKSESDVKYNLPRDYKQICTLKRNLYMPTKEEQKCILVKEQKLLETEIPFI